MFKSMHNMENPLVICNVWDAASAVIAQNSGFSAIGTSSAAIAKNLGKEDGENISFENLLSIVDIIGKSTTLPLTVDIEAGCGHTPEAIAGNIIKLTNLGVVGINIEDSIVVKGERQLCDKVVFAKKLAKIRTQLRDANIEVFINVRSDAYLLNVTHPLKESISRISEYQVSGADGIFLPCIETSSDIQSVVASTALPINVMCVPNLPTFSELKSLGVKRISMGNFVHEAMLASLSSKFRTIQQDQCFNSLFN
ncbi:isocitrate lyase/phosphoenolpyruvate mutase family protein [Vibrio sp. OCN044]|uniref:Isocitrate lyase/phosphoenolpyruvate mutase family protein n=1 Tax=Vibrio tetraodonis subsp. pristinus TaxID=2695891 RepID=A0A6L8LW33_9VIBR|nr:isocitrate lyase/phosphoenolpyruvate mutase family protein [Vibrio tetraodonis]MYM60284.1 isocitrate lyase/phosphoenolpyruvate mutase family protein [Vibrio tetraodonis subsp. pristinus]